MQLPVLSVREIRASDIEPLTHYWLNAEEAFLKGMGVDTTKMPVKEEWEKMLSAQLGQAYPEKQSYCIIWEIDHQPVGHSNVNKILFGQEAYMHLHLWQSDSRQKGCGASLVKLSLPYFFNNLQLRTLCCEPYALNPAPNKTLEKAGFEFIKEYITIPGFLNFEQPVKRWELSRERYQQIIAQTPAST